MTYQFHLAWVQLVQGFLLKLMKNKVLLDLVIGKTKHEAQYLYLLMAIEYITIHLDTIFLALNVGLKRFVDVP